MSARRVQSLCEPGDRELPGVTRRFVKDSPVFEEIDPDVALDLLRELKAWTLDFEDEDSVITAGDELDVYPVVVMGGVRATIEQDGVDRSVAAFGAGESFAEAAAMNLGFCPASVWAQGTTRVLCIPALPLASSPQPEAQTLMRNLSMQMSRKVKTLVSYISIIGEPRLSQRILAYLDTLPRRADGYVLLPFSQKEWAGTLRVDEKSLSRRLKLMRENGELDIKHAGQTIILRNPEWK